ncbi:MAG: hypothetical protein KDK76_03110 [Chlamydiia bacterium]|nr:hypothetical protein [Chlamydiia bacterium]
MAAAKTPTSTQSTQNQGWGSILIQYCTALIHEPTPQNPLNVTSLGPDASQENFTRYLADFTQKVTSAEQKISGATQTTPKEYQLLTTLNKMKSGLDKWIVNHPDFDADAAKAAIAKVETLRAALLEKTPNKQGRYSVPTSDGKNCITSLSSPGMKNQGNTCYLASLFQGLMGNPITKRWVINGEFDFDNPQLDEETRKKLQEFVKVLKHCAAEFSNAQRAGKKEPLTFLNDLRSALRTLKPSISKTGQEDPHEILMIILGYLKHDGNPLFHNQDEEKIFTVSKQEEGQLNEGIAWIKAFEDLLNQLQTEEADKQKCLEILQGWAKSFEIQPLESRDVDAQILHHLRGILICVLNKKIVYKENEKEKSHNKQMYENEITRYQNRIETIENSPIEELIPLARDLIDDCKGYPEKEGGVWKKSSPIPNKSPDLVTKVAAEVESPAFESFLENIFKEEDREYKYFSFTPYETVLKAEKKVELFREAPNHLFIQLNRTAGEGRKATRNVYLEESFYLDPKFTSDKRGGKYQVSWFCVHLGGGANGGHYVNFRKDSNGIWHKHDDSTSQPAREDEVKKYLKECCLIFVERESAEFKPGAIEELIVEQKDRALGMDNLQKIDEAKSIKDPERKKQTLVEVFCSELKRAVPEKDTLEKIIAADQGEEFPQFVEKILQLEGKDDLADLKGINTLYLAQGKKHIIEQYLHTIQTRDEYDLSKPELQRKIENNPIVQLNQDYKYFQAALKARTHDNKILDHFKGLPKIDDDNRHFFIKILSPQLANRLTNTPLGKDEPKTLDNAITVVKKQNEEDINQAQGFIGQMDTIFQKIHEKRVQLQNAIEGKKDLN